MFDWELFALLIVVCLPGLFVSMPRTLDTIMAAFGDKIPADKPLPSRSTLIVLSFVQTLVFVAITAAVGVLLAPRVGLNAPVFRAILNGGPVGELLAQIAVPTLVVSVGGAAIFLAAYYLLVRPNLDEQTVTVMEGFRMKLGLSSRVLYGGIVEEVIARWGLMTLFVWLGSVILNVPATAEPTAAVVWAGIIVSGVIFGLLHAPSYLGAGCKSMPLFWTAIIGLNLWASIIFGWLFWQYGLLAAMVAHMLFHLLWLPFDVRMAKESAVVQAG